MTRNARRYTYSKDKTVRCYRDLICPTEYDFQRFDRNLNRWMRLGGGWGKPQHGYHYQLTGINDRTLRGLLNKIAGQK